MRLSAFKYLIKHWVYTICSYSEWQWQWQWQPSVFASEQRATTASPATTHPHVVKAAVFLVVSTESCAPEPVAAAVKGAACPELKLNNASTDRKANVFFFMFSYSLFLLG